MAKDEWASEKKDLESKDAKRFIYTAAHLLLQRLPELTAHVRSVEPRIFAVALDRKAKPQVRLDAMKALRTLGSDTQKLAPLLAVEKNPTILEAVAVAIGGPHGNSLASEPAVTALIARFSKPGDWSPQYDAICALRFFADPRVEPTLRAALTHDQSAVRREAIYGLGHQRVVSAVPALVPFLSSTNPQHVTAAAMALTRIGTPGALAPLADKKLYAHALKLAKDFVEGRFAVRALRWFKLPTVDDDLLKLAKSEDGEVADGACDGLLHRRAVHALPPLATAVFKSSDPSYRGRFFLVLLNALAAEIEKPPATVLAELATVLSGVKPSAYEELLEHSDQLRYRIDRFDADGQRRVAAWRDAMAKKIKDPAIRAFAAQLMTSPRG